MRLGPSLLPDVYRGRSTRHQPAAAGANQRLALRIGTVQIRGMERRLDARQFSHAMEQALRAAIGTTRTDNLPARKDTGLVSESGLRAYAGASEVAQRLASLIMQTLNEKAPREGR